MLQARKYTGLNSRNRGGQGGKRPVRIRHHLPHHRNRSRLLGQPCLRLLRRVLHLHQHGPWHLYCNRDRSCWLDGQRLAADGHRVFGHCIGGRGDKHQRYWKPRHNQTGRGPVRIRHDLSRLYCRSGRLPFLLHLQLLGRDAHLHQPSHWGLYHNGDRSRRLDRPRPAANGHRIQRHNGDGNCDQHQRYWKPCHQQTGYWSVPARHDLPCHNKRPRQLHRNP